MAGWRTTFDFRKGLAGLGIMSLTACASPLLPTWNANTISLGATAMGILAKEGDCVVLEGNRKVLPIWPRPTRAVADGIVTPSGALIAFGSEVRLVGSYGQEGTPYWDQASDCGAIPFSVNHDGIDLAG